MPRRLDPLRQEGPLFGARRAKVQARCDQLAASLAELDRELDRIAVRRRALARELKEQRRTLWPTLSRRGRCPGPDGSEQLPPVKRHATFLWGRRLRAACLALLARVGPCTLTELHVLLHRHHLAVDGAHPVKALADALGYEADQGRVQRVARGCYRSSPEAGERWSRPLRPLWPGGPSIGTLASLG